MKSRLFITALLLCSTMAMKAQHREIGVISSATLGSWYGPIYDVRPVFKWGKSFESVNRLRLDRTYMNFANYQGQNYFNFTTGLYLGHEWRKPINNKLYFVHGPEIGGNYSTSTSYQSISPSLRYQFGAIYRINDRFTVALEAPMSLSLNMSQTQGSWNQSSLSAGMFSEANFLTLSYLFSKK